MTTARPGFRALLARRGYRRLWLARTVSQAGDVAQFTTLALLLLALTGSGLGVSGAVLAEISAVLLLAPLAGSVVDRLPRVRVMVASDVVRVLLAGVLAVWHDDALVAYAVAFGLSAGQVFFSPAAQSLLPTVVADDELVAANSGIWTAAVTVQVLVAPALSAARNWPTARARSRGIVDRAARAARACAKGLPTVTARGATGSATPRRSSPETANDTALSVKAAPKPASTATKAATGATRT